MESLPQWQQKWQWDRKIQNGETIGYVVVDREGFLIAELTDRALTRRIVRLHNEKLENTGENK